MRKYVLLGIGRIIVRIPRRVWQKRVVEDAQSISRVIAALSDDDHRVREFVVTEIPRAGEPLAPEVIGQKLDMPVAQVNAILADLERKLTFLFRNEGGAVAWAYPVTADETPHRVTFSTGEQGFAA
jgi:hypothetical protein